MQHRVVLIGGAEEEVAVFTEETIGYECRLTCEYRGKRLQASANDFFAALCTIRIELEKESLIPFCYGASMNVYPSPMCRDMGLGRKAYRIVMGKQALREDLVGTFEAGPDVIPVSVAMQREYFEEWIASLGGSSRGASR
jgi:hypothetical protein